MSAPRLRSATVTAGPGPCLLVHGGAWAIPEEHHAEHRDGLRQAVARGRALLEAGAAALEVAVEAVAVLEAHGAFDAGRGAVLNRAGEAELDAGVMDGATLRFGAVAATKRLAHPIRVARRLLEADGRARLLVGEGAERYAEAAGFGLDPWPTHPREAARFERLRAQAEAYHTSHSFLPPQPPAEPGDTVGCVCRDAAGCLAAATSTGGTPFAPPGRVGDSPLPGGGFYATDAAAASATGWGEAIATVLLCGRGVEAVAAGQSPESAVRRLLAHMHQAVRNRDGEGATGGIILLSREGPGAWAYTTPVMARGGWASGGEAWVDVVFRDGLVRRAGERGRASAALGRRPKQP